MSNNKFLSKVWQAGCILNDKIFYHGADFGKWREVDELGIDKSHGSPYQTSTASDLKRLFNKLNINSTDKILDIGCGKGRTMYILSKYPFAKVDGYDLSEELVEIANQNFKLLNVTDRCHATVADAISFNSYDEYNYLYFFNPVPLEVFKKMLANIQESLKRKPRKVILIYMHPVAEKYLLENSDFHLVSKQKGMLNFAVNWFDISVFSNEKTDT